MPYHDTLWAAHIWPVDTTLKPGFQPYVEALQEVDALSVIERDDYAIIRLSAPSSAPE